MEYSKTFYSRKPSASIRETSKTLYEGFFDHSGEGYETVKYDSSRNRFITYYLFHEIRVFHKDNWNIEINAGPFASMIARLSDIIDKYNFTESSIRYALRDCPVLTEYILNYNKYRGEHIICFDWKKDNDSYGILSILLEEYGRELSYSSKSRYINILVEFADKAIAELSRFNFNPKDLEPIQRTYTKTEPLPQWVRDAQRLGLRIGARILSAYIGGALSNYDIPDVDFGNADVPDVDMSNFDFDFDTDFDSEDFDISDYDFDLGDDFSNIAFGHAPNDGSYSDTGRDVIIQVAGGGNKGSYDIFLHHGVKYIDFQNQWIKIEGKTRFHLNGNDYVIKW